MKFIKNAIHFVGFIGFAGILFYGISGAADRYALLEQRIASLESQNQSMATTLTNLRNDLSEVQRALARLNDRLTSLEAKAAKWTETDNQPPDYDFPVPEGLKGEEDLATVYVRQNAPVKGRPDAPVVIVEFSDFQCPFCARFFRDSLPRIQAEYIDKGLARMYYLHLPLPMHPQAVPAAIAAECAARQGKFWEMHDLIFQNQTMLADSDLKRYLEQTGLKASDYDACKNDSQILENIQNDLEKARETGFNGTPSFIIGLPLPDGRIVGKRVVGAQPYVVFNSTIEKVLAASTVKP